MTTETKTVNLRRLTADEGMVITDRQTRTLRVKEIYLGKDESQDNFVEISEDTPLPEEADN